MCRKPTSRPTVPLEDAYGAEVHIGERMGWQHDFLHHCLVFAD